MTTGDKLLALLVPLMSPRAMGLAAAQNPLPGAMFGAAIRKEGVALGVPMGTERVGGWAGAGLLAAMWGALAMREGAGVRSTPPGACCGNEHS